MCKANLNIHLCTCETKTNQISTPIIWHLKRLVKDEWVGKDGMLLEPLTAFSLELTDEYIRDHLNIGRCFDFEYIPFEGDCITFQLTSKTKRSNTKSKFQNGQIYFLYQKSLWTIAQHNPFYTMTKLTKQGTLKLGPN